MNIDELKKIMNKSTAVLVMDNGSPSFVVMNYEMYKDLVLAKENEKEVKIKHETKPEKPEPENSFPAETLDTKIPEPKINFSDDELEILERINKDIQALRGEIEKEEKGLAVQ